MSRKFVLVPENLFKTFLQKSENERPSVSTSMEKVLHDVHLDDTAKKELYNQHQMSWLKHKKVLENRPVPVKVASNKRIRPSEIRVKRQTGHFIETPYAYPTPSPSRSPSPLHHAKPEAKEESEDEFKSADGSELSESVGSASDFRRASAGAFSTPKRSPSERPEPYILDMAKSIKSPKGDTPYEKMSRTEANMKKRQFEIKNRHKQAENINKIVMQNPDRYGVTANGEIINDRTGNKYATARKGDVKQAILKMLGSAIRYEPAGYKKFKERLDRHEGIRTLIESARFIPEKWS